MATKKACKQCGHLTTEKECPNCGSQEFADKYKGAVMVIDPENSEIGKKLNIENQGVYALKYS